MPELPTTAAAADAPARVHPDEIRRAIAALVEPGSTFELRLPKAGKQGTVRGYFRDVDKAAAAAASYSGKVGAIYITPNPVNPDLFARAADRLEPYAKETTADRDILRRRWLLIDVDPDRPAGISSTESEHTAALALADRIKAALTADGWPEPIMADSGNGGHLLYRIDLPNDDATARLVAQCLHALAQRFNTAGLHVDTAVANAARIWKLYGTLACKGDNVPDRPHRLARIIHAPDHTKVVSSELLAALADSLPKPDPKPTPGYQKNDLDWREVEAALDCLNPDLPEPEWIKVGMALHDADSGPRGLDLWTLWSAKGEKYHPGDCERRWRGFNPGAGVGIGTLFHLARDAGWRWRDKPAATSGATDPVDRATGGKGAAEGKAPDPISLITGKLPVIVDAAETVLLADGDGIYQRAGGLVRVVRTPEKTSDGPVKREAGALVMVPVDPDYLTDRLSRLAKWQRYDSRKNAMIPADPPNRIAQLLLARRGWWRFPLLVGFVTTPTLRPDGSLLTKPGYDQDTGLLYRPSIEFPVILDQPTMDNARAALAALLDVVKDFPFQQPHDRSVALAMILTAVCRRSLRSAPLFLVRAPKMGSGKSLLVDVSAMIATGLPASAMSYTIDGDEARKRILSILLQGDPCVALDNIEAPLQGDTLCSVLTQQFFSDRVLGKNQTVTVPTAVTWFGTGNGVEVVGDMTTRVIPCNLDPAVERPEEREFSRDLYRWVPDHQGPLVAAALTVLRAYVVAGKPRQPIKQFGRFETWSDLVRSALVWLDQPDPNIGRLDLEAADPVRANLRQLLVAWHKTFGTVASTVKEALAKAQETLRNEDGERPTYPAMADVVQDIAIGHGGKVSGRQLGDFIKKHQRRVEAGARLVPDGVSHQARLWRLEVVDKAVFSREVGESGESGESVSPSSQKVGSVSQLPRSRGFVL